MPVPAFPVKHWLVVGCNRLVSVVLSSRKHIYPNVSVDLNVCTVLLGFECTSALFHFCLQRPPAIITRCFNTGIFSLSPGSTSKAGGVHFPDDDEPPGSPTRRDDQSNLSTLIAILEKDGSYLVKVRLCVYMEPKRLLDDQSHAYADLHMN